MKIRESNFFINFSIFIIIYVVLAFGLAATAQPFRLERYVKPFVVTHIVASMGWLILFAYQAVQIRQNNIERHRKMLTLATMLVVISALFSVYITYAWGSGARFIAESRDVLIFAVLFWMAIRYVRQNDFESHKRLILMASLNLIHPAHVRIPNIFDWPVFMSLPITFLFWIAIPLAYDKMTKGNIHRATKLGLAITLISFVVVILIIFSPLMPKIDMLIYGRITSLD